MSDILNTSTKQITENQILPADQMAAGFDEMMEGKASPVQIAAFLIALKMRGETLSDIAVGAESLRRRALRLDAQITPWILWAQAVMVLALIIFLRQLHLCWLGQAYPLPTRQ